MTAGQRMTYGMELDTPEVEGHYARAIGARVHHDPSGTTCHTYRSDTVRDFFLASKCLEQAIAQTTIRNNMPIATHDAVLLRFQAGVTQRKVLTQKRFPDIPGTRSIGPRREPLEWWDDPTLK